MGKSIFTIVIMVTFAALLTALVAIFDPWTTGQPLPSPQPMANAFEALASAIRAQFAAHVAVGEQVQWYGIAILFASATICLLTVALMRAATGTPRSFGEWMPYAVMLPITGAAAAIAGAMWIPLLVDLPTLIANTVLSPSHLFVAVAEVHGFLWTTGTAVASTWNWWIWAAITATLNLPALALVAFARRRREDDQVQYLFLVTPK